MVLTSCIASLAATQGQTHSCLCRFDKKIEQTLRQRRRDGRHMPHMMVIPPGLDFSNLKVDLPKDPALEEMKHMKPAFGGSPVASESGSPRPPQRGASMANLRTAAADSDGPLTHSLTHSRTGSGLPLSGFQSHSHLQVAALPLCILLLTAGIFLDCILCSALAGEAVQLQRAS